jgi:hypothetical protein
VKPFRTLTKNQKKGNHIGEGDLNNLVYIESKLWDQSRGTFLNVTFTTNQGAIFSDDQNALSVNNNGLDKA